MTQERIEAAAEAIADVNGAENVAQLALAAADAVMFSDEAIERAAKLLCAANNLDFDYWERYPEDSLIKAKYRDQARSVVAALKGEQ